MSETVIWNLDAAHSSVGFSIRHLEIADIRGTFSRRERHFGDG